MSLWGDLLLFAGILALGQFSPGPDMLLLTQTSLARGRRAGWLATLGITTGLMLHATVAIAGMAVVLAQGGWITIAVKTAAALYLTWLGIGLIRHAFVAIRGKTEEVKKSQKVRGSNWYLKGLLCNLLNPKAALFFAGVVAPFLQGERPPWWPFALGAILIVEATVLWGLWVQVLQHRHIRALYAKAAHWIDLAFGLGLLALAVLLLVG